jgi:benzoyl-CoA reductase/2-hydroxyglutaryl-CoA dehydratase subunit BcrC/BadD/HgdB
MTVTQNSSQIDSLIRTFKMLNRFNRTRPDARQSRIMYFDMLTEYYTQIKNAHDAGKMIASHPVFFPAEILYAMDIVPMHTEMTTWMDALFLKEQGELLSKGAELGLAPEICSPHRGVAGMFALQKVPRPDIILWSNLICDNTAKFGELVMEITGSPGFFLDNPFQNSPAEMSYLVGELKDMIHFLEEKTGRKIDYTKLSDIVARMDHEIELYREISDLRKAVPCPMSIDGYLELLGADYMFPGQPSSAKYLTLLRDELKIRVESGRGVISPERFRLMTLFIPPLYLISHLADIYGELGVVSVVEPMFTRWSEGRLDPSRPLESIALKSFLLPERRSMYGPFGQTAINDITESAELFKVDGAVYWAFLGCRHTCATIKIIKETLNDVDVPMLTIDCDLVDPTVNSTEDTQSKLQQFIELLEER